MYLYMYMKRRDLVSLIVIAYSSHGMAALKRVQRITVLGLKVYDTPLTITTSFYDMNLKIGPRPTKNA